MHKLDPGRREEKTPNHYRPWAMNADTTPLPPPAPPHAPSPGGHLLSSNVFIQPSYTGGECSWQTCTHEGHAVGRTERWKSWKKICGIFRNSFAVGVIATTLFLSAVPEHHPAWTIPEKYIEKRLLFERSASTMYKNVLFFCCFLCVMWRVVERFFFTPRGFGLAKNSDWTSVELCPC